MKPATFKTIIVGLDFSKGSKNAYQQGLALSQQMGAKPLFVYVFRTIPSPSYLLFEKNKKELSENIKKKLITFYKIPRSLQSSIVIKIGIPDSELIRVARKHHSPLIVISASGTNAISRLVLGSTAERIAVTSPAPVWIQKGKALAKIKSIIVPIDLSARSNHLLSWSECFLNKSTVKKTAVFVQTPVAPILDYATWYQIEEKIEFENKKSFEKLKAKNKSLQFKRLRGDAAFELCNFANASDLIIMAPHSRLGVFPTLGSVSAKVIRKSSSSVLVVPFK